VVFFEKACLDMQAIILAKRYEKERNRDIFKSLEVGD